MTLVWPKNPKMEDVISVANGLAARVAELEEAVRVNTQHREENVRAIRALLTILHPEEEHPIVTNEVNPQGVWLHDLVMYWLERYQGRIPVGEVE